MPKLKETKRNENWILRNHGKFNEMRKVMLRNTKIKEISNFGTLQNSEDVLRYQKPLMLLMKWTDIGKIAFAKLLVLDHHFSASIASNLSGSIFEVLFRPNLSLSSKIHHSSLSIISKVPHNICFACSQKLQIL